MAGRAKGKETMTAPSQTTIPRGWLSITHAAIYADVSPATVRDWLKRGLRHSAEGRKTLIKITWLDDFLESRSDVPSVDRIVDEVLGEKC